MARTGRGAPKSGAGVPNLNPNAPKKSPKGSVRKASVGPPTLDSVIDSIVSLSGKGFDVAPSVRELATQYSPDELRAAFAAKNYQLTDEMLAAPAAAVAPVADTPTTMPPGEDAVTSADNALPSVPAELVAATPAAEVAPVVDTAAVEAAAIEQQLADAAAEDAAASGAISTDGPEPDVVQQTIADAAAAGFSGATEPMGLTGRQVQYDIGSQPPVDPLAGLRDQAGGSTASALMGQGSNAQDAGSMVYSFMHNSLPIDTPFPQSMVDPSINTVMQQPIRYPSPGPAPTPPMQIPPNASIPSNLLQMNLGQMPPPDVSGPNVGYAGAFVPQVPAGSVIRNLAGGQAPGAGAQTPSPPATRGSLLSRIGMASLPKNASRVPYVYRNLPSIANNVAGLAANTALIGGSLAGAAALFNPNMVGKLINNVMGRSGQGEQTREDRMRNAMKRLSSPMVPRNDAPAQ